MNSIQRVIIAGHRVPAAEAAVLEVLLAAEGPLLVAQVRERLGGRPRAHTTVITLLGRLVERGLAAREGDARAHRYRPAGTEQELALKALSQTLEGIDDPARALVAFINGLPARTRRSVTRGLDQGDDPTIR